MDMVDVEYFGVPLLVVGEKLEQWAEIDNTVVEPRIYVKGSGWAINGIIAEAGVAGVRSAVRLALKG